MLELVLIRHGETAGNIRPTALGTTDLPLTERGKRQAHSLSRIFRLEKPEAIYASPLKRAQDTAIAIAEPHHMTVETMLDLSERNFGLWEGLSVDEIQSRHEAEYAAWQADLVDYVIPCGESAREVYDRNVRLLDELLRRHTEGRVLLVTHLGCIRSMLAHLLGMGIEGSWRFKVHNGAVCRLQIDETGYGVLTSFNEI